MSKQLSEHDGINRILPGIFQHISVVVLAAMVCKFVLLFRKSNFASFSSLAIMSADEYDLK